MEWLDDPEPDGDLPSDIRFAGWLANLDPLEVLRNYRRTKLSLWERNLLDQQIRLLKRRTV